MKITVYNSDGGVGKSPIATNIALDREYALCTNEEFNLYDTFIPEERLIAIGMEEAFPQFGNEVEDVVFDLAGSISPHAHSITSALMQSDLIIVPALNQTASLQKTIGTLGEITALDGLDAHILIVATKLKKGRKETFNSKKPEEWTRCEAFQNIKAVLTSAGFHFPMLPLKYSDVFDTITEKEMSIAQLRRADPLSNYNFRDISAQFDEIYKHIDRLANASEKRPDKIQAA